MGAPMHHPERALKGGIYMCHLNKELEEKVYKRAEEKQEVRKASGEQGQRVMGEPSYEDRQISREEIARENAEAVAKRNVENDYQLAPENEEAIINHIDDRCEHYPVGELEWSRQMRLRYLITISRQQEKQLVELRQIRSLLATFLSKMCGGIDTD